MGLIARLRSHYPPHQIAIRLLALQAICWLATNQTLMILELDKRPAIYRAMIGTSACVIRSCWPVICGGRVRIFCVSFTKWGLAVVVGLGLAEVTQMRWERGGRGEADGEAGRKVDRCGIGERLVPSVYSLLRSFILSWLGQRFWDGSLGVVDASGNVVKLIVCPRDEDGPIWSCSLWRCLAELRHEYRAIYMPLHAPSATRNPLYRPTSTDLGGPGNSS